MNAATPSAPFKPVSKNDAAELLGVSTKTVDNYIKAGLLPLPRPFGGRELWHPDIFFACLRDALMPSTSSDSGEVAKPLQAPREQVGGAPNPTARELANDSSPIVRQKQRQAELLSRLNANDGT